MSILNFAGISTAIVALMLTTLPTAQAEETKEKMSIGSDRKELAVTIYNNDLALVRDRRVLQFDEGLNRFALRDVSGQIRPETASMVGVENNTMRMLEQNFDFDLLSPGSLMNKFVGQDVIIYTPSGDGAEKTEKATIISNNDGLVLKYADRIETGLPKDARIQYPGALPQNLRDHPTLVVDIMNDKAGKSDVDLSYLTSGLGWKADYVAQLNKDETELSLAGWVTLTNTSGTQYDNAKLQLVAGDVNVVKYEAEDYAVQERKVAMKMATAGRMNEEQFFEYHLYTLDHKTTLKDNQTKQVALLNANNVKVQKQYEMVGDGRTFYQGANSDGDIKRDITTFISFDNEKDNNLGMALPKGTIRVYKPDNSGNMLFTGEDRIEHTAEKQKIQLKLGNAFDITGHWKQVNFKQISRDTFEASVEVKIDNAKDIPVEVVVKELMHDNWSIVAENLDHNKTSANTVQWKVPVKAKESTVLTYTVRVRSL